MCVRERERVRERCYGLFSCDNYPLERSAIRQWKTSRAGFNMGKKERKLL